LINGGRSKAIFKVEKNRDAWVAQSVKRLPSGAPRPLTSWLLRKTTILLDSLLRELYFCSGITQQLVYSRIVGPFSRTGMNDDWIKSVVLILLFLSMIGLRLGLKARTADTLSGETTEDDREILFFFPIKREY